MSLAIRVLNYRNFIFILFYINSLCHFADFSLIRKAPKCSIFYESQYRITQFAFHHNSHFYYFMYPSCISWQTFPTKALSPTLTVVRQQQRRTQCSLPVQRKMFFLIILGRQTWTIDIDQKPLTTSTEVWVSILTGRWAARPGNRGLIPGYERLYFPTCLDRLWNPHRYFPKGSFPEVKRPGREPDRISPHSRGYACVDLHFHFSFIFMAW
jgi:hypothetical protein